MAERTEIQGQPNYIDLGTRWGEQYRGYVARQTPMSVEELLDQKGTNCLIMDNNGEPYLVIRADDKGIFAVPIRAQQHFSNNEQVSLLQVFRRIGQPVSEE